MVYRETRPLIINKHLKIAALKLIHQEVIRKRYFCAFTKY